MAEALIYDAVRTPRGKGKKDGKLHEITPVQLATQVLQAVRDRTNIDTADVDDVVLGCVAPVGEQGSDIARTAVLNADYAETTAGVQINRFCASGLEAVNMAAAKVISGEAMFAIGGGVESMSRVPMGADGGAWPMDPAVAYKTYFMPQGIGADLIATKWGFSRNDVDAYAMESQKRAARAWSEGRFKNSVVGVKDVIGEIVLDRDEHMRPAHRHAVAWAASTRRSRRSARACPASTRSRSRNTPRSSASITSTPAAIRAASSTAPPPSSSATARWARNTASSPARASSAWRRSGRSRRSC